MYTSHGINMKRELEYYDKRTKRIVPNQSTPNYDIECIYSNSDYDECYEGDCKQDYKFKDMVDSVKECISSDENKCTIKSCVLNKEIPIDKKAVTIGAVVAGISIGLAVVALTTATCLNKPRKKDYYSVDGWKKIVKNLV